MPSAGTNNILFRPITVPRNGAMVPMEVVPVPGIGAEFFPLAPELEKSIFRLVLVPENQIPAPRLNGALGYVHTWCLSTSAWAWGTK